MIMVNKEQKQKDGFGLPSTDVRKKDNALIEAARIADKIAKWKAEFEKVIPKVVVVSPNDILEEIKVEEPKGPTKEELKVIEALKVKAAKVAELKKALAEAEKE